MLHRFSGKLFVCLRKLLKKLKNLFDKVSSYYNFLARSEIKIKKPEHFCYTKNYLQTK